MSFSADATSSALPPSQDQWPLLLGASLNSVVLDSYSTKEASLPRVVFWVANGASVHDGPEPGDPPEHCLFLAEQVVGSHVLVKGRERWKPKHRET